MNATQTADAGVAETTVDVAWQTTGDQTLADLIADLRVDATTETVGRTSAILIRLVAAVTASVGRPGVALVATTNDALALQLV